MMNNRKVGNSGSRTWFHLHDESRVMKLSRFLSKDKCGQHIVKYTRAHFTDKGLPRDDKGRLVVIKYERREDHSAATCHIRTIFDNILRGYVSQGKIVDPVKNLRRSSIESV